MILKINLLTLLCAVATMTTFAQSQTTIIPESYIAYHCPEPIEIDGKDTDASWNKVDWTNLFIDIEGIKKPTYDTQVKMLWDATYFYILVKMEEPHVWADITEHDAIIFYNNDFEVFIDPDGDTHNYYEIEVNAINTVWDLFINKPYRENNVVLNDWTATGMKTAITIDGTLNNPKDTDKGWMLEMAIPWDVFKKAYFEENVPKDDFWRVNFSRVNWDHDITEGTYGRKKDAKGDYLPEYNWVWSSQGVINMHEPEKWGYVYFSSKEAGEKDTFEIPNDEKIKWEMYNLFRAQKKHYETNKQWATSVEQLYSSPIVVEGKTIRPKIETHSFGWTISAKSPFTDKTLIIKEDGEFLSQ
ncbi:carbohydrate-binding family 9-like protein [Gelidibacter sp.]|uniref:carbohydrate-binding family 9-like protein n=1 Tax=Gelidibacter sp. TaxID=2018083 RepID=UPI002C91BE55|nr:carbohydrate-binding family 9-like protein [Gelidibacter sp.]HUH28503.1 carbohydrate-binding family 9-like protein [Gelidibacter sp.]